MPGSLTSEGVRSTTNALRVDGSQHVVYLDEHDPRAVLRTWVETNRAAAEGMGPEAVRRRVRRAAPDDWSDAVEEVLDAEGFTVDHSERGTARYDGARTCPLCGEEVSDLATHLQGHG